MPRIVTIGGGTGQFTLLSGLKTISDFDITAIVAMSDSGGSSGTLRTERGALPPGDLLRCLLALATADADVLRLFGDRFTAGGWLGGHTLGNLAITTGTEQHDGDILAGIATMAKLLGVRGRVLPVTRTRVDLCAERDDGTIVRGEHAIGERVDTSSPWTDRTITDVWLDPEADPLPETLEAIASADAIVVGPGSLFTSIIPNVLVRGVPEALRSARAQLVYVVNTMTEASETDEFTAVEFVQEFERYAGRRADAVIYNTQLPAEDVEARYRSEGAHSVLPYMIPSNPDDPDDAFAGYAHEGRQLIPFPLLGTGPLIRHDPIKLAHVIRALL